MKTTSTQIENVSEEQLGLATNAALRMTAANKPQAEIRQTVQNSLVKAGRGEIAAEALALAVIESAKQRLARTDAETMLLKGLLQNQQMYLDLAASITPADEEIVISAPATQRPPFIVRIIPLIPDLITRGKDYLLVVTNKCLRVARLTRPFNAFAAPKVKGVVVEAALASVASVELESGLRIVFSNGESVSFNKISDSNARDLGQALRSASQSAALGAPAPAPAIQRRRGILRTGAAII